MEDIKCPNCDETWTEEIQDDIGDIGCPSCRRCFDMEDFAMYE